MAAESFQPTTPTGQRQPASYSPILCALEDRDANSPRLQSQPAAGIFFKVLSMATDYNRTTSVRVLVVEDFESFRRFIWSMLRQMPELRIIGEASDGLEAVREAEELRPDLILLDVGLPTLNGIEAARRIRTLSPESKIIFVSQQSDPDVVQEALNLGARGYVVKTRAASDLLPAVKAVILERQFVSPTLVQPQAYSNA
jgi:CheY-like chemotaxis protein